MSHWYLEGGEPYHFTLEDDPRGAGLPVTLREARPRRAAPSVTTILGILAKPGLEFWKEEQLLNEALKKVRGVDNEQAKAEIRRAVREASDERMGLGTRIHSGIEDCFHGVPPSDDFSRLHGELLKALHQLLSCEPVWVPERRFFDARGWGGAVDLHSIHPQVVIDWKTTANIPKQPRVEHGLQLAAYASGLGIPKAILLNVYIDVNDFSFVIKRHKNTQWLLDYWLRLVALWQVKHKYYLGEGE